MIVLRDCLGESNHQQQSSVIDYSHMDDHTRQTIDTPGFKLFTTVYCITMTVNMHRGIRH